MTEHPSQGSLPNTKAVCLQAHSLSGSSSLQPHQHQSAGLQPPHQHVDVTVAFIATGVCCLNKSLFLWLQLEGDTLHALLALLFGWKRC